MISVVIATRDRAQLLAGALRSLAAQHDAPPFEAIVVDNGSTDGTAAMLARSAREHRYPLVAKWCAEPNRGLARNVALGVARGETVLFVDDDVVLPRGFLQAHARAQERGERVVTGPILNVSDAATRPRPTLAAYSGAYFCTCNASVPRAALQRVGGFDARFELYGWEDTELGLRLRAAGVRHAFAWDAYLHHVKPPAADPLPRALVRAMEKGRMAARLLAAHGGRRARFATGAHGLNFLRAALVAPERRLALYAGLAGDARTPVALRAFARAQLLDGAYLVELRRERRRVAF